MLQNLKKTEKLIKEHYLLITQEPLDINKDRLDRLIKATQGIPIIIIHTVYQIFERKQDLETVCQAIEIGDAVDLIEFSFKETLSHINRDTLALKILFITEIRSKIDINTL